jgi:hypothetical protein
MLINYTVFVQMINCRNNKETDSIRPLEYVNHLLNWPAERKLEWWCHAGVDFVWNVMAHAQKPDFVFRLNGRLHLNRPGGGGGGFNSVDYWQARCAHQPAGFALLVQACVLQSCDAYWLPTPFYYFPLTSPPVLHRVPSHFKRSLPTSSGGNNKVGIVLIT